MIKYRINRAFSMVEMMLLLLIASLIVAASVPIITKRHLHMPTLTTHGSYACYYKNGELWETRKSGRLNQKTLSNYPRKTANCVFEPPTKAIMFQITAIGGGGGGGDAGQIDAKRELEYTESNLSPFDIDDNTLKDKFNIDAQDPNYDEKLQELKSYMGKLWAFAQASDSGNVGDLYYTNITPQKDSTVIQCPDQYKCYKDVEHHIRKQITPITLCSSGSASIQLSYKVYACYPKNQDGTPDRTNGLIGGYVHYYNSGNDQRYVDCTKQEWVSNCTQYQCCDRNSNGEETNCRMQASPVCNCRKCVKKSIPGQNTYWNDGQHKYKTGNKIKVQGNCPNLCQYATQTNCQEPPCEEERDEELLCNGDQTPYPDCIQSKGETSYEWVDGTKYVDCHSYSASALTTIDSWREYIPGDMYFGNYNGSSSYYCEEDNSYNKNDYIDMTYMSSDYQGCYTDQGTCRIHYEPNLSGKNCENDDYYTEIIYSKFNKQASDQTDNNSVALQAGKSPFCASTQINGDLNLSFSPTVSSANAIIDNTDALKGLDINYNSEINQAQYLGFSFCGSSNSIGTCGPSQGQHYKNDFVSATINNNNGTSVTIKSQNGQSGAIGMKLKQAQKNYCIYNGLNPDKTEIVVEPKTYYYDEFEKFGEHGTDGKCYLNSNEQGESSSTLDCRKGTSTSTHFGYCLKRHNMNSDSEAVLNGQYTYERLFDYITLKHGEAGKPGEFKTIVVRTLKGIDTTIKIGRGGSAGALSSGVAGLEGSPTSFGDILTARGGIGGDGSIVDEKKRLPIYNDSVDFHNLQNCFTTANFNGGSCTAWKANPENITWYHNNATPNNQTIEAPTKTAVGGMFSFALKALGVSNEDEDIQALLNSAGRGGSGGGIEHFCWAGQHIIRFEDKDLVQSSVYNSNEAPEGAPHKIPDGCASAYRNVPASPGFDGALIITW